MLEPSIVYINGEWKREQVIDDRRRELESAGFRAYPIIVVRDANLRAQPPVFLWLNRRPNSHDALNALGAHMHDLTNADRLHIGEPEPRL